MKAVLKALTEVAEPLRGEYEERDGLYHLKVEGDYAPLVAANEKVASFRDNNIELQKTNKKLEQERGALATKLAVYDGIDPDEHRALKTRVESFEKKGIKNDDDVTAMILAKAKEQVDAATKPLTEKLLAAEQREKEKAEKLAKKEVESVLRDVATKAGVEDTAIPDFLERGNKVFKYEDGNIVAKAGENPMFSKKDPSLPLGPAEWAEQQQKEAPHLFKQSNGGGAAPRPGSGGGAPRQGVKQLVNPTPQQLGNAAIAEQIRKGELVVVNQ